MELRKPQRLPGHHSKSNNLKLPCIYQMEGFPLILTPFVQQVLPRDSVLATLITSQRAPSFQMLCPVLFVGASSTIIWRREVILQTTPCHLHVACKIMIPVISKAGMPILQTPTLWWTCILILLTMNFPTKGLGYILMLQGVLHFPAKNAHSIHTRLRGDEQRWKVVVKCSPWQSVWLAVSMLLIYTCW